MELEGLTCGIITLVIPGPGTENTDPALPLLVDSGRILSALGGAGKEGVGA